VSTSLALVKTRRGHARKSAEKICDANQELAERNRRLLEHLPQVHYIARRIHDRLPRQVPLDDLIHAGVLGLIEAIRRFDPTRNVKLKSYARYRIEGAILDSLRQLDWGPRPLRRKARQIEQAHQALCARLGRAATDSEVAEQLGIGLAELQHLLGELRGLNMGSLKAESGEGGAELELSPYLLKAPEGDPYYLCLQSEIKKVLAQAISELPKRERELLALYYYDELTMKEVGAVLGVGEGRISQIHASTLLRLRTRTKALLEAPEKLPFHATPRPALEGELPEQK
jgi:RNA polymerase sigma factor FliA